jgi:Putative esterase
MKRSMLALFVLAFGTAAGAAASPRFEVSYPADRGPGPFDGRLLLLVSTDFAAEPRFQISDTSLKTQLVFGIDVDAWKPGETRAFDSAVLGFPIDTLKDLPAGTYSVQALLHKYETFHRADGHVVKLPMDRGEGQQWNRAPGNLYSTPKKVVYDPAAGVPVALVLDQVIAPSVPPTDSKYIRHERIRSEKLSKFWGRDMYLGAALLLPWGFDEHPQAHYPLVINHGHFSPTIEGWRETPPDPDLKPTYSERFHWEGYNRTEQEWAYQLYKDWTSAGFPRVIVMEVQHANPYYDDSYAVNSQNLGPYGDAIVEELIPYIEKKYRGLGAGWARFMYGGSTGGWEAIAAQTFYPDEFGGSYAACPDPVDFSRYMTVNLYEDQNAFYPEGDEAPWRRVPRPAHRDYLGHVSATVEDSNRLELVLGTRSRSGGQWDIWEAVYSPVGPDGYPQRIFDKQTGRIDKKVVEFWRENYDVSHILARDWAKGLGRKLEGKINVYVGDMDNYYLNDAVYELEKVLKATQDPAYGGEVDYGDRDEHCWNGDHDQPNAISRLRYHQMFIPKIAARIQKTAPVGADLVSWKY